MNLDITTHDGNAYTVAVDAAFDLAVLNTQLNDQDVNTVIIGDVIESRFNVKSVKPAADGGSTLG